MDGSFTNTYIYLNSSKEIQYPWVLSYVNYVSKICLKDHLWRKELEELKLVVIVANNSETDIIKHSKAGDIPITLSQALK